MERTDSAGHDEVIYVGTGGQLAQPPNSEAIEMQQMLAGQTEAIVSAKMAAER